MKFKSNWQDLLPYKSVLRSIVDIEERNNAYWKLDRQSQKFEVCIDMLTLMEQNIIVPDPRSYWGTFEFGDGEVIDFEFEDPKEDYIEASKFQERLCNIDNSKCQVCQRGAVMLSTIRLGNRLSADSRNVSKGDESNNPFSFQELIEMEGLFEDFYRVNFDEDLFYYTYEKITSDMQFPYSSGAEECMVNMCLNVLYNGDFDILDTTDYLSKIKQ